MNEILSRNKIKELSPMIIKENNTEITNKLDTNHKHYFKNAQNKNFNFKEIDEETIKITINNLPKKNSCGSN